MSLQDIPVAIVTDDKAFGQELTSRLEELGALPGVLDTLDEVDTALVNEQIGVAVLDEPTDEMWARCVKAQNESDAKLPVLVVVCPTDEKQAFDDAGADFTLSKPSPTDMSQAERVVGFLMIHFDSE